MRISEYIARLEELNAQAGDIKVVAYAYGDIDYHPVLPPETVQQRDGEVLVLVEGGYA